MKNLEKENLDRRDWIQKWLDPRHLAITTNIRDTRVVKFFGPILLELSDDLRNTSHVSLRCNGDVFKSTPIRMRLMFFSDSLL